MESDIKFLVDEFKKRRSFDDEARYWVKASSAFRIFWQNKIMKGKAGDFEGREYDDLDPIIRLLDSHGTRYYSFRKPEEEEKLKEKELGWKKRIPLEEKIL